MALTLDKYSGDEAGLPLVVDEAEVLARVDGEDGRHVEAEVGRGEVHPLGRPQDHSSVLVVRDELGRRALFAATEADLYLGDAIISFQYFDCNGRCKKPYVSMTHNSL